METRATERTDEELMAAYVAGDARAFEALYTRLSPWLLRLMSMQLSRRDEAQDLVQQAFLQLHQARRDFRAGARLRPWLVTIALNLKRGYFRWRKRRPEQPLSERAEQTDGAPSPERSTELGRVREALGRLPEAQREVLVLHYFGGLSYREIEQSTGVGLSAIKQRARRAYEVLRVELEGRE